MVGSGFYAGIFCMCLARKNILQGRIADVIQTDGEKLDPGESTNEFCVDMRHHVPHQFTPKLQTARLARNRIIRRVIKNFFLVSIQNNIQIHVYCFYHQLKRSGHKTNNCGIWFKPSYFLLSYNLTLRALLIGLFRSDQVQIPFEMISSTEAEPTLTPSAA